MIMSPILFTEILKYAVFCFLTCGCPVVVTLLLNIAVTGMSINQQKAHRKIHKFKYKYLYI